MITDLHDVEEIANVCVCDVPQNAELGEASCGDGILLLLPVAERKLKRNVYYIISKMFNMSIKPIHLSVNRL